MRQTPFRHNRTAARNNSRRPFRRHRNKGKSNARVYREIINALFRLFDQACRGKFPTSNLPLFRSLFPTPDKSAQSQSARANFAKSIPAWREYSCPWTNPSPYPRPKASPNASFRLLLRCLKTQSPNFRYSHLS